MSDNKVDVVKRLVDMVGFDPAKRPTPTAKLMEKVLSELQQERLTVAEGHVKEQLKEAINLREQMHKVKSEFDKQYRKFEEQLGKLLNGLENSVRGQPTPEPTAEAPAGGTEPPAQS